MFKITILYVENSPEDIDIMKHCCKKYADRVDLFTFQDGIKFLDFLESKNRQKIIGPVCIVLDIDLPFLNGLEILERLKASQNPSIRSLPVVMYSSSIREHDKQTSQSLGARAHIQKPLTYEGAKSFVDRIVLNILVPTSNFGSEI